MYRHYVLFFVFAYHVVTGLSLPATTYDQRQTGDLNVQVHLKDVQVLALLDSDLLDDYTEYDYFYDYADFTLNPIIKPTTSTTIATEITPLASSTEKIDISETSDSSKQNSTSLSTSESQNTNSTTEDMEMISLINTEKANETLPFLSNENSEDSNSEDKTLKTRINDRTRNLFEDDEKDRTKQNGGELFTENPSKRLSRKRCRSGYSPDGKGRCRRLSQRRLSLIPLAMRLAPKLLDDLAHNTRKLAQDEVDQMHSNRAVS